MSHLLLGDLRVAALSSGKYGFLNTQNSTGGTTMFQAMNIALASLSSAKAIAEGLIVERDAHKIALATSDLLSRLIEVQGAMLEMQSEQSLLQSQLTRLQNENLQLEQKLSEVVGKRQELVDYELTSLAYGAISVLAQKPVKEGFRQPPYLCAACAETGKKSVLSFQTPTAKSPNRTLVCPAVAGHTLVLPRGGWTLDNLAQSEFRPNE